MPDVNNLKESKFVNEQNAIRFFRHRFFLLLIIGDVKVRFLILSRQQIQKRKSNMIENPRKKAEMNLKSASELLILLAHVFISKKVLFSSAWCELSDQSPSVTRRKQIGSHFVLK
jgi:hypothetical protein